LAAEIYKTSGWHFSYMMTEEHIEEKIKAFSHQEFNKPEILNKISIKKILENKEDLLSRDGFKFDFCSLDELPKTVRENTFEYRNLLH
jgi:beta-1,4-mannosyl-glycoprotein beta-1,4-N-acetylglucosaminyltransferase